MKLIHLLATFVCLLFAGCYTQFATLENNTEFSDREQSTDTCATCDSAAAEGKSRADTVVVLDRRGDDCYWTRDFWGEPYLKCVKSAYSRDWFVYSEYPWWYRENRYGYDSWGRCPRYYNYDPSCGCCRHYSYMDHDYYRPSYGNGGYRNGGGGGSTPVPSVEPKAVPRRSPVAQSRGERSSGMIRPDPPASQSKTTIEQVPGETPPPPVQAPVESSAVKTNDVAPDTIELPGKARRSLRSR